MERKQLPQNHRQAEMDPLTRMAAGIAHEINNPLAIVRLLTEKMVKLVNDKNCDEQTWKQTLETLQATITRISTIMGSLRSFAGADSSAPVGDVNTTRLLIGVITACKTKIRDQGVQVTVKGLGAHLYVRGAELELSRVLMNLIENAFDAVKDMPNPWISIECDPHGEDEVWIRVRDGGAGIPTDIRNMIMHLFFTTKEVGEGAGLGLSVSKGIVEMYNGRLFLNEECANTEFVVALKRSADQKETAATL